MRQMLIVLMLFPGVLSAAVKDITYSGGDGEKVSAFLVTPKQADSKPGAAVVFVHWGLGDRHAFLDEAQTLSSYGVTSLLIDAPFVRGGTPKDANTDLLQAVADVRAGIDLLAKRSDVDKKRIGFVGHSYGAHVGALLAAQEPRLAAVILAGAVASNAEVDRNPAVAANDAEKWIGKQHPPMFLQFARNDEAIPREQADRLIAAATDPAIYKWYEGNHAFNATARADRLSFLSAHLGFKVPTATYQTISPDAAVKHDIGRLGVVFEMPGMQHIESRRDIAFKPDLKMDVDYPFGMKSDDRLPAILLVNGQSDNPDFQKALRTVRLTTTMAEALAVRTGRIIIVPDIRGPKSDPTIDLIDLMKYLGAHADELQVDASQIGILSRSAGYSYALRAASEPAVKAIAVWYGDLSDPNITINKNVPALVVTCGHDFWSNDAAAQKFVAATGAQRVHLPDGDHGFEIWDDLEQSRDAFVRTATFLREHLPVHRDPD